MAISKITLNGVIQMDLTGDTVTAQTLLDDITAHGADGTSITGEYVAPTPKTADDVIVSGATVTIPAGAYSSQVQKSVASGTAGTPTASKGAVNNHSIAVTPSVTNTTGYITGSTINGTAVTVSASELVSGDKSITQNGSNIDVADYATVTVNVSGGGLDADYKAVLEGTATNPSFPSRLTTFFQYRFYGMTSLTALTMPNTLTTIEQYAFYNCVNLTSITWSTGLTTIGISAFQGCTGLSGALTLPSTLTSIGSYGFSKCIGITSLWFNGTNLGFASSSFNGASGALMTLQEVHLPNNTKTISTSFGSTTVANACQQLAFIDCGSVTLLVANAFANCYALQTVVLRRADSICTLNNVSAFLNTPMRGYNGLTGTVYVPNALISTYQTANNWKTLYDAGTVSFVKIEGSIYEL